LEEEEKVDAVYGVIVEIVVPVVLDDLDIGSGSMCESDTDGNNLSLNRL
jgi:hypothetical protein